MIPTGVRADASFAAEIFAGFGPHRPTHRIGGIAPAVVVVQRASVIMYEVLRGALWAIVGWCLA